MSTHINAENGTVAKTVLLPGDPLRAEHIAQAFLEKPVRYNTVRNMFGFTGYNFNGKFVSVQGSGMGMPSLSIYVNELVDHYGVEKIIRVGSCGALQKHLKLKDIVIAAGACTDSGINRRRFKGMDFAPIASWELLRKACEEAEKFSIPVQVGNILATDLFYNDVDPDEWQLWAKYGVLAVEMETAELYTLAAHKGIQALTILTVSDLLPNKESLSAEERQNGFDDMVKIALLL